jgi:hypothetical protein
VDGCHHVFDLKFAIERCIALCAALEPDNEKPHWGDIGRWRARYVTGLKRLEDAADVVNVAVRDGRRS